MAQQAGEAAEAMPAWRRISQRMVNRILGKSSPYHVRLFAASCSVARDSVAAAEPIEYESLQCRMLVAAGDYHTMCATGLGTVYSWGEGDSGQLGLQLPSRSPRGVRGPLAGQRVVHLAAGSFHSACCTAEGAVYTWGQASSGKLGRAGDCKHPVVVAALAAHSVVQVAAGYQQTVAVTATGALFAWGGWGCSVNYVRQPTKLGGELSDQTVVQVAAGHFKTFCVTANGSVYSLGRQFEPALVFGGRHVVQVATGTRHSVCVTACGEVLCWGEGDYGMLGLGDEDKRGQPTTVGGLLADHTVVQVAAGQIHTFAVTNDGKLFSWGGNLNGQLGVGDTERRLVPTLVAGALSRQRVVQVSGGNCGHLVICATQRGTMFTWGDGHLEPTLLVIEDDEE